MSCTLTVMRIRYYKSNKALGQLYRRIDEKKFFSQMRDNFQSVQSASGGESLLWKLERYLDREAIGIQWTHHRSFAIELREEYGSARSLIILPTDCCQVRR